VPLKELEKLVRSGQFAQGMREFLALDKESLAPAQLGFGYHCVSVCQFQMGDTFAALRSAEKAAATAESAGDKGLLGRIWINLIALSNEVGDTHMALSYGERWLNGTDDYPHLQTQEARVRYNLGLVHWARREREKALQELELAVFKARCDDLAISFKVQASQMYAWCLYQEERIDEGDRQVLLAGELIEETDVKGLREQLLLKCLRAYKLQDRITALKIAEEFVLDGIAATDHQRFWATWIIGRVALENGQYENAMAMATLALEISMRTKDSRQMNEAGTLKRVVHERLNGNETAGN
jgi:tetratricopeptide (TPR) repeat protein